MTIIGIGIGIGFNRRLITYTYPPPPWADNLTDAATLGWQQFGTETNVGTFGPSGFSLTVQGGNDAQLVPVGAILEHSAFSVSVDSLVHGTMTPSPGAFGILQVARYVESGDGYAAHLNFDGSTFSVQLFRSDAGVGFPLSSISLAPAIAWGGIWLKVNGSGADTVLNVYALHENGTWQQVLTYTDPDASDNDNPGVPFIGMIAVGGDVTYNLTAFEATIDASRVP